MKESTHLKNDPFREMDAVPDELRWIERFTRLLDYQFTLPGTRIKFGLDPLIGIVPYFGEVVSFSISGLLVLSMIRHGASGRVVVRMLFNLSVDAISGLVPVLGDIFDVYYKANRRNYRLLLDHQAHGRHRGSAWPLLLGAGIFIIVMLSLMIWGVVEVVQWLAGLL